MERHFTNLGPARAGPTLQTLKPRLEIIRLTCFVILTPDHESVFFRATREANIMVWNRAGLILHARAFCRVPIKRSRNCATRDTKSNYVSCVRGLLGVNNVTIIDRRVARYHHRSRANGQSVRGLDLRLRSAICADYLCAGKDPSPVSEDGPGQPAQVLQWMKL